MSVNYDQMPPLGLDAVSKNMAKKKEESFKVHFYSMTTNDKVFIHISDFLTLIPGDSASKI